MKGIILAGGSGTRLYPTTQAISKQLLPIYDKPMVYYPLTALMLAGLTRGAGHLYATGHLAFSENCWARERSGAWQGFSYAVQPSPDGLAQALVIGKEFLAGQPCCLVLETTCFTGRIFRNCSAKRSLRPVEQPSSRTRSMIPSVTVSSSSTSSGASYRSKKSQ